MKIEYLEIGVKKGGHTWCCLFRNDRHGGVETVDEHGLRCPRLSDAGLTDVVSYLDSHNVPHPSLKILQSLLG